MGLVIFASIISSFGALFFKYSSRDISKNILMILTNKYLYFGVLFYCVSALIFVFALKFGDLSTLYPFVGFGYIGISLLSIKVLKEKMNDLKWFGILMIIIGIMLAGFGA
ncbi:hypothetical protein HYT52_04425 [Candidatus Woesearchaeota archaeon]|nr:hypothetical protein [Candidatus Woesearchaeota archaeon]